MKLSSLQELYVEELQDIYNAENQIIDALPDMIKKATDVELRDGLTDHLAQTRVHVERLEDIFRRLDAKPEGRKCKAMKGLLAEGGDLMKEDAEPDVRDAGIISSAQKVEHYEMAAYGCVRTYASLLGDDAAARLLQETLDEESEANEKLTEIASKVNVDAATHPPVRHKETVGEKIFGKKH